MLHIIHSPLLAIRDAKKDPSMKRTMMVLLVASLLFCLTVFFNAKNFSLKTWATAIMVFVTIFLLNLFIALLFRMALYILTQRGGYYQALTTITYGSFISGAGMLLVSIIGLIPMANRFLTFLVVVLSIIILVMAWILSMAVTLRLGVELFQTDYFTIVITLLVVYMMFFFAMYFVVVKSMVAAGGALGIRRFP